MASRIEIVRFLAAVVAAFVACLFVSYYSRTSGLDFVQTFGNGVPMPFFTRCVAEYSSYAYLVPVLVFGVGITLMRRRASDLALEMMVGFAWIGALGWVLFAIWAWRIAMVTYV